MDSHNPEAALQLSSKVPPRIRAFHDLWLAKAGEGLPDSSHFDVAALSADYPLLARIGFDENEILVWRDVSVAERWPFGPPVKGRPVQDAVPPLSIRRVMSSFRQTLSAGIPDYFETTSWMHGGRTVSLARLVAPVLTGAARELVAFWEVLEPPKLP